ncbi:cupin [Xenorhabdus mauleonii]|uniref:Cupin n=1 Tax=Xenorhabdus mauleonii TaxID=351675 RepID=A0A1I3PKU0_9GAMM|nr:iron-containing redox enzyme family protein [Xenorhabdus mauleonii]PHM44771.1 cupin [Xenorhabdus mauleonii]SFJ21951.1 Iron-containing redox enzyme [Xenorhabdus mauleonii]
MKTDIKDTKVIADFSTNNHELCRDAILNFCDDTLFIDNEHRYEELYWGRRLRPHVVKFLNFKNPLKKENLNEYSAFAANRILFAMNEVDFLMLPNSGEDIDLLGKRYNTTKSAEAYIGMPYLEKYLFSFLDDDIKISEHWSKAQVKEYFYSFENDIRTIKTLPSSEVILNSKNPELAAKDFLVQLCPDFLIESSPMARYAPGNYGQLSSSLFKVIIDELGYGCHNSKHSTLFENTLNSVGLSSEPHKYWQYYLNGSLLLANYYNSITRNKNNFFKYIGAIYLAETGFIQSCKIWKKCLETALPGIDTKYFSEHHHIDVDHSRMVLENLVMPAIDKYGNYAAREIIRGFEEARLISDIADSDFVKQTLWKDSAEDYVNIYKKIWPDVKNAANNGDIPLANLDEPLGELSITHSHDKDELCHVIEGQMEFLNGFGKSTMLGPGDGIIIEHNRLHGALIHSENCKYQIYTIGDVNKWQ